MSDNSYQIHQIIPAPIPMQAVYYDLSEEELVRQDVICLAIVHCYPKQSKDEVKQVKGTTESAWNMVSIAPIPDSYIRPMVCEKDGNFIDPEWLDGFLGIEINGKPEDWEEEIRELMGDAPDCDCPVCMKKKLVN